MEDIVKVAQDYFDNLFSAGPHDQMEECINVVSRKVTPNMQQILSGEVSADEIKAALFQMDQQMLLKLMVLMLSFTKDSSIVIKKH